MEVSRSDTTKEETAVRLGLRGPEQLRRTEIIGRLAPESQQGKNHWTKYDSSEREIQAHESGWEMLGTSAFSDNSREAARSRPEDFRARGRTSKTPPRAARERA